MNKKPVLRFNGYTDDWDQRKLKDAISSEVKGKARADMVGGETHYLDTRYLNGGSPTFVDSTKDVNLDDVLILWDGSQAGKIYHGFEGALGSTLKVFRPIESGDFLYQYLTKYQQLIFTSYRTPNIPHVINNFTSEFKVKMPILDEQVRIGVFLKEIDTFILLHQYRLDVKYRLKQTMLAQLFPKTGHVIPELRFSGHTDAWEQRKLKDMTDYKNGKGHEDRQSNSGKYELVNLNSISINGGLKHSGKFVDDASDTLLENDLVMVLSDVGHGDLLGRVALIPEDDRFVLNQRVALLRPNDTVDPQFLFSCINAHQQYFKSQGAGMSQLNISKGSVENFTSYVPHKKEQAKIGAFFRNLDHLITLHQRELDYLKNQKVYFLKMMFV